MRSEEKPRRKIDDYKPATTTQEIEDDSIENIDDDRKIILDLEIIRDHGMYRIALNTNTDSVKNGYENQDVTFITSSLNYIAHKYLMGKFGDIIESSSERERVNDNYR